MEFGAGAMERSKNSASLDEVEPCCNVYEKMDSNCAVLADERQFSLTRHACLCFPGR